MSAIVRWFLNVVCMMIVSVAIVEATTPSSELTSLIEEAYQSNQDLLSMAENARALRAEAPFAGSLQDPVVGFAIANLPVDSFAFDQEPMTQKQLFASQKFPWFGTLNLRQQVSQLKFMEADFQVQNKRLAIAKNLAGAWYDLGSTRENLEINENLKSMVTQILRVAETKYATGEGLQ